MVTWGAFKMPGIFTCAQIEHKLLLRGGRYEIRIRLRLSLTEWIETDQADLFRYGSGR